MSLLKFCNKHNIPIEYFPDGFKKRFNKFNELIDEYSPGSKGKMTETKEERQYNYNEKIINQAIFSDFSKDLSDFVDSFKALNNEFKYLEENKNINIVLKSLMIREFMHEAGRMLKKELETSGIDKVVLWGRDAALIPGSNDVEYYIAGESSITNNGRYYRQLKNHVNTCYELDLTINKEHIKEKILKNIKKDKEINEFNKRIDDFIDNSNAAFFDTGFTGLPLIRTSVLLNKEEIPIILASKSENINYAKSLNVDRNKVILIEHVEKPLTQYVEFDRVTPYYYKIINDCESCNKKFIAKEIEKKVDEVVFTHMGFECFDKEVSNIEKKVSKFI